MASRFPAWAFLGLAAGLGIACAWSQTAVAQNAVNPDSALVQEFQKRVAQYLMVHKNAEGTLHALKPTDSQAKIRHHQHELREAIVKQRIGVRQGNIFSPEIAAEFRHLIGIAYEADATHIRESFKSSEPIKLRVYVNKEYPDDKPLQTMPPSLLINLPQLPPELEYRVTGQDLILRDIGANLIVDIIAKVIPK